MKPSDVVKTHAPRSEHDQGATHCLMVTEGSKLRIHGLGPEDSWEAMEVAAYRKGTGAVYAKRLYNSEPDLVHRRLMQSFTKPRHQRSATCSTRELPARGYGVRQTISCPVPPRPAYEP